MEFFFVVLALAAGLLLVAGAFVYLVDPRQARRLLGQLRVPLVILMGVFVVVTVVNAVERRSILVGVLAMSLVAYFVREYRKPKREKRLSLSGVERKPMLPSSEPKQGKEQEQQ